MREAHEVAGAIVKYCEQNNKALQRLTLSKLTNLSGVIEADVTDVLNEKNGMRNKKIIWYSRSGICKKAHCRKTAVTAKERKYSL